MELWRGKIAIVTGAGSGIGAAIARALVKESVNVVGLARRPERVEKLAEEVATAPGKLTAHKCDVTDLESIKATFAWVGERLGQVDILVNNAGIYRLSNIFDEADNTKDLIDTINTNFTGMVLCSKEAFKLMKKTDDYGYIININSVGGHQPVLRNVYAGSKFAVRAVTDVMRHELFFMKNKKIRISSISPGFVETDIMEAAGMKNFTFEGKPHLKAEDLADHVLFLLTRKPHIHIKDIIVQPVGEF